MKALNKFLFATILIVISNNIFGQERVFKKSSIRTGIGIGLNSGERETGMGMLYLIGWQKSIDKKNKLRINPNIIIAGFRPFLISDTPIQYYRMTMYDFNIHYDLIRFKGISIATTLGVFGNYSRGLIGAGVENNSNLELNYFYSLYFGATFSAALRINPKSSKIAYEIRPIAVHAGNKQFLTAYLMFGIDIKFEE